MSEKDMREILAAAWDAEGGCHAKTANVALRAMQEVERRTIERCAKVAQWACMVEPDGGSPTEAECAVADEAARRIRSLQDAPSDDKTEKEEEARSTAWPSGCPKNSSCARNKGCMYGCKAHRDRPHADLVAEITAETARREAAASHPDDTPPAKERV